MDIEELYPHYRVPDSEKLDLIEPQHIISLSLFLLKRSYMADNQKCFRIDNEDAPAPSDVVSADSCLMSIGLFLLLKDDKKTLSVLKRIHFIIGTACGVTAELAGPDDVPTELQEILLSSWLKDSDMPPIITTAFGMLNLLYKLDIGDKNMGRYSHKITAEMRWVIEETLRICSGASYFELMEK